MSVRSGDLVPGLAVGPVAESIGESRDDRLVDVGEEDDGFRGDASRASACRGDPQPVGVGARLGAEFIAALGGESGRLRQADRLADFAGLAPQPHRACTGHQ
ncbi:transposase [Streptomyces sp. NPDC001351]|uniref:transposase n=1 Tax=Streptomyces sp. NPDC001351 TaxID=3364564 RepID=UPI0036A634B3